MRSAKEIIDHHLSAFGADDLEGVLSDYTDESVLITSEGVIDNLSGMREFYAGMMAEFNQPGTTVEIGDLHVCGDLAMLTWRAETSQTKYEFATDTYVFKDGKVLWHTYTGKFTPKQ